ncbi:MAG: dihydrolipoamide acetyltransferase family protein, partial [Sphingomicrobium sp.]
MATIDILVPDEQEGTKAVVRSWLKKVGDTVALNDPLVELETDKVTQEVPSPGEGVLDEILLDSDAEAEPGALLGRLRIGGAIAGERETTEPVVQRAKQDAPQPANGALSPAVRRALRERGLDAALIVGTGRGGRLTRADVDQFTGTAATQPSATRGPITIVPHDRMRLAIAQNMISSVTVAPHVTAVFEADFSAIVAHRKTHKVAFERDGANLTFTAYFIAAAVAAMRAVPAANSRWFDDRLELYEDINIGIGTALGDKGLIVPVVAGSQHLSLLEIARRLGDLTARARDGKLNPADVKGGTFTISNHGVSGSLFASPIIINQPQSAILGIGKTEKRVVVREIDGADAIQVRPMAYVSLTIDHRVLDGHQTNG